MNGPLAGRYATLLSDPEQVVTPTIVIYEVCKKILRERTEPDALAVALQMEQTQSWS